VFGLIWPVDEERNRRLHLLVHHLWQDILCIWWPFNQNNIRLQGLQSGA
jgi:hypothetical protein